VARDEAAALFWPDKRNEDARRNLRRILHAVRRLDFAPQIEQRAELLRWSVDSDLAEFERTLNDGRAAQAVALVRGPLGRAMEDPASERFNEWLAYERGRVGERWRTAVLALMPQLPPAAALEFAERLLASDPFDDDALRAKLAALAELGRTREVEPTFARYAERLAEDLGVEANAGTRALATRLAAPVRSAPAVVPTASPAFDTGELIGRAAELEQVRTWLANDARRLLTICGPGGVGKTRLAHDTHGALQADAHTRPAASPSGALWIDLYDLAAPAQVAPRLAAALGMTLKPNATMLEQVIDRLANVHMLVVLDNCEHLVLPADGSAGIGVTVQALLEGAPHLRVLATSRRRLGLPGEQVIELGGLDWPPAHAPAAAVLGSDAARLFCLRARANDAGFEPTQHAAAIAEIGALTEGLPLALELAAAWVRLLPCAEIALELRAGLDVLEARVGNRGMRAVLERSWQLAAPHEREVLAQLAVFLGGFSREAARAVAGASLPALANLADASLLRVEPAHGTNRFSLHPLVREFARDKLAADAARHGAALDRHVDFHGRFLQQFAEFKKLDQKAALDAIGRELENCIAAWRRAAAVRAADFFVAAATPLENYFNARGRFADGIALFEYALGALDPAEPAHLTAVAVTEASLAILQFRAGAIDAAEAGLRRTLSRARIGGLGRVRKSCLNTLALVMWQRARWDESKRLFAEALKFARADNDVEGIASFLGGIAMVEKAQGRLDVAARLYARVAAMARQSRNAAGLTTTLNNLGNLFRLQGKFADARAAFGEALALADARGFDHHRAYLLMNLGLVAFAGNDLGSAGVFAERALEAARANGTAQVEANALGLRARVAVRRGDHVAAHALLAEGLQVALSTGIVPLQGVLLTWYGELLAAEGAPERAATIWNWAAADERNEIETRQAARALLAAVGAAERERGAALAAQLRREELLAEALRTDAGGAAVSGPVPP
jgi:predicted ATPase/DNA-binding SARP family transcriptional activator/Tfp pilus assembly protein PilF